MRPLQCFFVV